MKEYNFKAVYSSYSERDEVLNRMIDVLKNISEGREEDTYTISVGKKDDKYCLEADYKFAE